MYSSHSDTRNDRFNRHKVPRFRKDDDGAPNRRVATYRPKRSQMTDDDDDGYDDF